MIKKKKIYVEIQSECLHHMHTHHSLYQLKPNCKKVPAETLSILDTTFAVTREYVPILTFGHIYVYLLS